VTAVRRGRAAALLAGGLLAAACFALVAACTSPAGTGGPPPPAPSGGAVITAQGIAFDRQELTVPADRPFPLLFENREGPPHNVTIHEEDGGQPLFIGETFSGPASRTYAVPAIPAGRHRFRCDLHPEMSGTVIAVSG
jgi:plastocyanin